jgi:O-antigen/teichoic acid export membrane protein
MGSRLAWGTASNVASRLVMFGVWFFLTPVILHGVGASSYGLWALIGSLAAYGALLDFGVGPAVTKYVAELHARNDRAGMKTMVATAFWLYAGLGVIAVVAAVAIAPLVPRVFNIPPGQDSMAEWLTIVSGLAVAVELPTSTTYAVLRGLQEFTRINIVSSVGMLALAGTIVAVLHAGGGLIGIAVANIVLTLVVQIPMVLLIRRSLPEVGFRLRDFDRSKVRTIFAFSSAVFAIDAAAKISTKTDEIVIGAFLPVRQVAPYSFARRLASIPQLFAAQFEAVILPVASALDHESEPDRLRPLALMGTRLTLVGFLPIGCGLTVLAGPFLSAWVGPAYADDGYLVAILVGAWLIAMSVWPVSSVLQAMAKHRPLAKYAIGASVVNLGLSIALVKPLGVKGVALGTLVGTAFEVIVFVIPYAMRTIGLSLRDMLREVFVPAFAPAVPALAVLYGLREWLDPSRLVSVLAVGAVGGFVYAVVYLALCARPEEREAFRRLLRRGQRSAAEAE